MCEFRMFGTCMHARLSQRPELTFSSPCVAWYLCHRCLPPLCVSLEHGKCNSDDEDAGVDGSPISSSPSSHADGEEDPALATGGWSKGKRSRRVKMMTVEDDPSPTVLSRRCTSGEEDLANCLVML